MTLFPFGHVFEREPSEEGGAVSRVYLSPSARRWRQRACYRRFSLATPFCTGFLGRETRRASGNGSRISLSGEVVRCEALAGREDISSGQGQEDKERHIITSPHGLRLSDPIGLRTASETALSASTPGLQELSNRWIAPQHNGLYLFFCQGLSSAFQWSKADNQQQKIEVHDRQEELRR